MFLLFSSKFGHACKGSLSSLSDFILHRICSNLSMFIVKDQRIPDGWSVWLSGCDACEQPRTLGQVLLHGTSVAWARLRLTLPTPKQPWLVPRPQFGDRMRQICRDFKADYGAERLPRVPGAHPEPHRSRRGQLEEVTANPFVAERTQVALPRVYPAKAIRLLPPPR